MFNNKTFEAISFFFIGILVAFLAWDVNSSQAISIWTTSLLLLFFFWGKANTRLASFLLILGYYLQFSYDVPITFNNFLPNLNITWGYIGWITHSIILSLPWIPIKNNKKSIQFPFILILITLPPFATINWANPLIVSGLLMPGMGIIGLFLTGWFCFVLVKNSSLKNKSINYIIALTMLSVMLNVFYKEPLSKNIIGVNTNFKGGSAGVGAITRHIKMTSIANLKIKEGNKVVFFPEEVGLYWTEGKKYIWNEVSKIAKKNNAIILLGVDIEHDKNPFELSDTFSNALVNTETGNIIASARIPMPLGSWRWFPPSATNNIFSTNIIRLNEKNTSVSFCYEDSIMYLVLSDHLFGAEQIISVANNWMTQGLDAEGIQQRSINLTARLVGLPLIRAKNI